MEGERCQSKWFPLGLMDTLIISNEFHTVNWLLYNNREIDLIPYRNRKCVYICILSLIRFYFKPDKTLQNNKRFVVVVVVPVGVIVVAIAIVLRCRHCRYHCGCRCCCFSTIVMWNYCSWNVIQNHSNKQTNKQATTTKIILMLKIRKSMLTNRKHAKIVAFTLKIETNFIKAKNLYEKWRVFIHHFHENYEILRLICREKFELILQHFAVVQFVIGLLLLRLNQSVESTE